MEQAAFDYLEGMARRDKGMAKALTHAEDVEEDWGEKALKFLHQYAKTHREFSGEAVRAASRDKVLRPPSLRAWGAIMVKAAKHGWIKQVGYTKVLNPRAHRANAAVWRSCL